MVDRSLGAWARARCTRERLALLGTGLAVGLGGALLVRTVDVGAVVATARAADPALLTLALAVYLASWPARGRRYGDVLAAMDHRCRTGFLTALVFASQTANLAIPARAGDGVRAYLLNERRGVPYPAGIASLAVERAFDLVAVAALGGAALAVLLAGGRSLGAVGSPTAVTAAVGVAGVAVVCSAATVAVARSDRRLGPALRSRVARPRAVRVVEATVRFGAAVRVVAAAPRSLGRVFASSAVVWGLDALTAVLVLAALVGDSATPATLLAVGTLAVSAGNLAKVFPLSQGGIGLYEAAFTGLVVSTTAVPVETAVAAAILDHALKNAVTLGGGGLVALLFNLSPTSGPDDDAEASNPGPPAF